MDKSIRFDEYINADVYRVKLKLIIEAIKSQRARVQKVI